MKVEFYQRHTFRDHSIKDRVDQGCPGYIMNINYLKYRGSGQVKELTIQADATEFWGRKLHAQTKPKFLYQERPW